MLCEWAGAPAGAQPVQDCGAVPDDIHNLADAVRRSATRHPSAPALIADEATITWAELNARVDAIAAGLRALGLTNSGGAPARVAIALPNIPEFADAYFGVLRAGFVAVAINPAYTAREVRHQLDDSQAEVLIATPAVHEALADVQPLPALRRRFSVLRPDAFTPAAGTQPFATLASLSGPVESTTGGPDLAVLIYTSGTSGLPKGAMLTHQALIANHVQLAQADPPVITSADTVLLGLPLFHAFGLNAGLGAVAWHGACGVLAERFDPDESLELIARHQVTVIAAVPQIFAAWGRLPDPGPRLASVRIAVSGAAPLGAETARRVRELTGHQVYEGYGLTETAPVLTTNLVSPVPKAGSVGRPIPGVEIKLVAADGTDVAHVTAAGLVADASVDEDEEWDGLPGTDPGQVVARGANLFSGYWPDGADGPDADGWWATGDVAYADHDGDLFLVDRLGELILVSGFNVYPHEIEIVLSAFSGVQEAAAVGIDHPLTGQAVKAFVVIAEGAQVSAADLTAHCERNLARFKCPREIEFVEHMPHTATGKVRKTSLRNPI